MKFTITALVFFCLCSLSTLAQTSYSVKGNSVDSVANIKLANTSISILNAKDSTLRKFTGRTNGSFSMANLNKGKFILLVTYPGYADYVEHFALDSTKTTRQFRQHQHEPKIKIIKRGIDKRHRSRYKN
jgi:hypothetical protein